jgi:hypothetical protein
MAPAEIAFIFALTAIGIGFLVGAWVMLREHNS